MADKIETVKEDQKASDYMPKKEKPKLKMSRYTVMLVPDSADESKTYEFTIDKIARYVVLAVALLVIITSLIVSFAVKNYRLMNDYSLQNVIENLEVEKTALEGKVEELEEIIENYEFSIGDLKARMNELELETAGLYIPNIVPYKGSALMISDTIVPDSVSFNCLMGTTAVATANGVVEEITEDEMYGQTIVVDHLNGYKTKYTTTGKVKAKLRDNVVRGEALAEIQEDDESISYAVYLNDKAEDPKEFFLGKKAE